MTTPKQTGVAPAAPDDPASRLVPPRARPSRSTGGNPSVPSIDAHGGPTNDALEVSRGVGRTTMSTNCRSRTRPNIAPE
jgi:hypothetical protein